METALPSVKRVVMATSTEDLIIFRVEAKLAGRYCKYCTDTFMKLI